MRNAEKTKEQLISEIQDLRRELAHLRAPAQDSVYGSRSPDLAMLTRISTAFDAPGDPDEAIESIAEELQRQLGVRECSIWLLDSDSGELLRQHAAGPERGRAAGWRASLAGSVGGWVVQSGESLIVAEAPVGVAASEGAGEPARAILSVPLKTQCRTIGVLELADTYGNALSYMGNINVQVLNTNDKAKVRAEVQRKMGGMIERRMPYILHSDHSIPPDVRMETYRYMLELHAEHGAY